MRHYLMATEEYFEAVVRGTTEAAQKPAQQTHATEHTEPQAEMAAHEKTLVFARVCGLLRLNATPSSGGDRTRTDAPTPEKNAISESGAAECGAVASDAAIGTENDPELSLLIEAWPSLRADLRLAIVAIVRTGLAARSNHPQGSLPSGPDDE
ncbi:MAG: hypothetical protein JXB62_15655 [Pirellulales bacterium]|nr:hypothetical protein [Pirellulales bacterium]